MADPPPTPKRTNPDEHAPGMSRTLEEAAQRSQDHADRLEREGPDKDALRQGRPDEDPPTK